MVRAAVCGTEGRQFESVPVYQKMNKEKKLSANNPSGFVDRFGKELALKENLIAKIEENFLKFGFSKPQKYNVSAKRLHISASAKGLLDPTISQSACVNSLNLPGPGFSFRHTLPI